MIGNKAYISSVVVLLLLLLSPLSATGQVQVQANMDSVQMLIGQQAQENIYHYVF